MSEDGTDARIGEVVAGLLGLSRLLAPEDLHDLLGAISVEMETAMEVVLENRHRPKPGGSVVSFPGPAVRQRPPASAHKARDMTKDGEDTVTRPLPGQDLGTVAAPDRDRSDDRLHGIPGESLVANRRTSDESRSPMAKSSLNLLRRPYCTKTRARLSTRTTDSAVGKTSGYQ